MSGYTQSRPYTIPVGFVPSAYTDNNGRDRFEFAGAAYQPPAVTPASRYKYYWADGPYQLQHKPQLWQQRIDHPFGGDAAKSAARRQPLSVVCMK